MSYRSNHAMKFDISKALNIAAKVADAIQNTDGGETITIRHAGIVVTAPFAGNEDKTMRQILAVFGSQVGIPGGARPSVISDRQPVSLDSKVEPKVYDCFTDKKENACS